MWDVKRERASFAQYIHFLSIIHFEPTRIKQYKKMPLERLLIEIRKVASSPRSVEDVKQIVEGRKDGLEQIQRYELQQELACT